jgi:ADP-ribosylglycohydrolase
MLYQYFKNIYKLNNSHLKNINKNSHFTKKKLQNALGFINKINNHSLSNGFLMRIWPIAIFHSLVTKYNSAKEN